MSNDNYPCTTDLSKFGTNDLKRLELLLTALREQGLPKNFGSEQITPMLNMASGYIFLTNSDHEVAMLNDEGNLGAFYNCPICGAEGFFEQIIDLNEHNSEHNDSCINFINDIKESESSHEQKTL